MKKFSPIFITLLLLTFAFSTHAQGVVINEILEANTTINVDEDGTHQDWVELFNNGASAVNLAGYGLSDDSALPYKWVFPNVTLDPGAYLLIWCSDKNRTDPSQPLHTNFKLSSAGDTVILTNTSGITVDSVPATASLQNISYGRLPNGTGPFKFFAEVTPAAANSTTGYDEALTPPTFSQEAGFYVNGFNLSISTTIPGATILYTLDGSEPKVSNLGGTTYSYKNQYPFAPGQATGPLLNQSFRTFQYSGSPISIVDRSSQPNKISAISTTYDFNPTYIPATPIFKGTVVRAKVVKAGALDSQTVTKSYYISPQGASKYSLPVVSLSVDENLLFDYNQGTLVAGVDFDNWRVANPNDDAPTIGDVANFFRRGSETERNTNFTYFINGAPVLNQDIGLRIHGGSSRVAQNKSFVFYSRSDYGDDTMSYQFFNDRSFDSFQSIVLHNSGNDYNQTMFRDALCHQLLKNLHITTKGWQPTVTFLNGEYWGILSFRDKIDDKFFSRVYNIASADIQVLENEYWIVEGGQTAQDDYYNLVTYMEGHTLSDQANYDYITTQMDPESFKDYYISNIFLENADWPVNNIYYWRKKTASYTPDAPYGQDGRWRWMAHDMDDTFAISNSDITLNSLADATEPNGPGWPNAPWSTLFLRRMLENPGFKTDFINRFADLLNTTFLTSRMLSKMAEMKSTLDPEAPGQFARWGVPENNGDWNYFLGKQTNFINQRPSIQRDHIRGKFGIANNINATLNVSNPAYGYIKINTIDIKEGTDGIGANPYPWTGIYFSNVPVKLKAIALPGYVFSHWTGASSSTADEITINSASSFSVTAVFTPETTATSHPIYYWMMTSAIANNLPLQTLNTTYKAVSTDGDGVIEYHSCLTGYPFTSADPNWRKASMERRNSPTDVNYFPELNSDLPFLTSDMKGLQIKEPLQSAGQENLMVFNFSTHGYKDIVFSFAAINELTNATAILVDYSTVAGTPVWTTSGMISNSFALGSTYALYNIDFSSISAAENNPNFKIRLRFTGTNMTADTGARITFNNIAVHGTALPLAVNQAVQDQFSVFPNPFTDQINVIGVAQTQEVTYEVYSIDGRMIKAGKLDNAQAYLADIPSGIYLLQLHSDGKSETKKIIKK